MVQNGSETPGIFAGWGHWRLQGDDGFAGLLGDIFCLPAAGPETPTKVGMETAPIHANKIGNLHGGFVMAFIDIALFAILSGGNPEAPPALTVHCATDFLAAGRVGVPLIGKGRVVRGSGRLVFLEGMLWQEETAVARWNAIMRRISLKP